jgi:hypothetical protein
MVGVLGKVKIISQKTAGIVFEEQPGKWFNKAKGVILNQLPSVGDEVALDLNERDEYTSWSLYAAAETRKTPAPDFDRKIAEIRRMNALNNAVAATDHNVNIEVIIDKAKRFEKYVESGQ